jgi:arginase
MERREFLICAAATMGVHLLPAQTHVQVGSMAGISERTYHILGVPLRAGSLVPGNENDAQAYRDVQFIARMNSAGIKAVDDGDVGIPSYLPHHSIPPIRSWPSPRIAWECVSERVTALLKSPSQVPLLIGCDCSVVVGTTQALQKTSNEEVHVLYVDGDFDDAAPEAVRANSAAACAVWLLTNQSPFLGRAASSTLSGFSDRLEQPFQIAKFESRLDISGRHWSIGLTRGRKTGTTEYS